MYKIAHFHIEDFEVRLLLAFAFGALIGLERQWRNKLAGLRTNTLVSVGAALFVTISEGLIDDPSGDGRIIGQIVSGIGFLGAGIIMKDGLNVTGLNTAATIWCSAAIGCLCGLGHGYEALMGTAFILAAHFLLRPISAKIKTMRPKNSSTPEFTYQLHIECLTHTQNAVRDILLNSIQLNEELRLNQFEIHANKSAKKSSINVELRSYEPQDVSLDRIIHIMTDENGVLLATWATKSPFAANQASD